MKRPASNPSHRIMAAPVSPVAIGRARSSVVADLLMGGCRGLEDLDAVPTDDASLIADFADFISADESDPREGDPRAPDPDFRERLRRLLWRRHVHSRLRGLDRSH